MFLYHCMAECSRTECTCRKWTSRASRALCDLRNGYSSLLFLQCLLLMSWATFVSLTVTSNSSISWSYGSKQVKVWPHFHHFTLCWERRFEDLSIISAHSRSETFVTKLLEYRLWVSLTVSGVMAWDSAHFHGKPVEEPGSRLHSWLH